MVSELNKGFLFVLNYFVLMVLLMIALVELLVALIVCCSLIRRGIFDLSNCVVGRSEKIFGCLKRRPFLNVDLSSLQQFLLVSCILRTNLFAEFLFGGFCSQLSAWVSQEGASRCRRGGGGLLIVIPSGLGMFDFFPVKIASMSKKYKVSCGHFFGIISKHLFFCDALKCFSSIVSEIEFSGLFSSPSRKAGGDVMRAA